MSRFLNYVLNILIGAVLLTSLIISKQFLFINTTPKFFYFYFVVGALIVVYFQYLWNLRSIRVKLNLIDFSFLLYVAYIFVLLLFNKAPFYESNNFLLLVNLMVFYFITKNFIQSTNFKNSLVLVSSFLLIICLVQAFKGFHQAYLENGNDLAQGFLDNSGPYTSYLASVLVFSFGIFIFLPKPKLLNVLALVTSVLSLLIILLQSQRTAWIAAFIGLLYIINIRYNVIGFLKEKIINTAVKKIIAGFLVISCVIITSFYLYNLKKDSAFGRLFIWRTTVEMIADKPAFGFGYGQYLATHNNYQAEYFRNHPENVSYAKVAGNVLFAFNDYLQIASETGIISLILFLLVVLFAFLPEKHDKDKPYFYIAKAGLLSILISGLFSYPLQRISTFILFIFYLSIISSYKNKNIFSHNISGKSKAFLIIPIGILLFINLNLQFKRFNANKKWSRAYKYSQGGKKETSFRLYNKIYPKMRYDEYFLFNYGAELSVNGKYQKSVEILKEAEPKLNDSDFYLYLGNSYEGLGNYQLAIESFLKASNIIPHLFYPKYRLVKVYEKAGEHEKAISMANEILKQDVKIPSNVVDQIKVEMQELINSDVKTDN